MTKLAAKHNFELLDANDFVFQHLLLGDIAGSEFCPVSLLEPIFTSHPLWTEPITHSDQSPTRLDSQTSMTPSSTATTTPQKTTPAN
jgi:hypothetical protein